MAEGQLSSKVALVTGAAKRIGRSIALRLASEGADVVVNYKTSKSEAEQLVGEIAAHERRAMAIQADVSKKADVDKLFAHVDKEFGRLDILVNNAGIFFPREIRGNDRGTVGPDYEWEPEIAISLRAGRNSATTARNWTESHRQHLIARRSSRVAGVHSLLRFESRGDYADAVSRARPRAKNSRE
jgi:NAD(P)-dependent dehydrogenase (short-subunit alcohol dehydrogenase family)